jgi:hypothetical protein
MSKQTAVEWLITEVKKFNTVITREYMLILFNQAKQMEKEQIIESHHYGYNDGYLKNNASSAKYYYENYGGQDEY